MQLSDECERKIYILILTNSFIMSDTTGADIISWTVYTIRYF